MNLISSDTLLEPGKLSIGVYSKLIAMLTDNDNWKRVAECFEVFSVQDIKNFAACGQPAEKLIFELGSRLCTIDIFCDILNECCLYSILLLFKPCKPMRIIQEPTDPKQNQMISKGNQLKLTCVAEGFPPPSYQWYCDNRELEASQESVLCVNNFGLQNEGEYYCLLSQEGYGTLASNSVVVSLAPQKPVIMMQPPVCMMCQIGMTVTLDVVAEGHPELKYQWFRGNMELDGCIGPRLKLTIENGSQAGAYSCYIYNCAGEIWTEKSLIVVYSDRGPEPSAKVALLIGNQKYDNLDWLNEPENDVITLANVFTELGFCTVALQNLRLTEMRNALNYFCEMLPKDAYVIFYFSGHGFETYDKFMLPVDAPGPEDYLQTDALSERELLKKLFASEPKLLFELLDMCLKSPNPKNKKIYDERPVHYEYKAHNNLIQAYATTSYFSAYETRSTKNGLYVEFLTDAIKANRSLPILGILHNVAKDIAKVCTKQKPFFGTNVTQDFRLTDPCKDGSDVRKRIDALSRVPDESFVHFERIDVRFKVNSAPSLGVFLNTLQICICNVKDFRVGCEAVGDELGFELTRINKDVVLKVMNVQRLVSRKSLTLSLYERNGDIMDTVTWDIGKPLMAVADLWRET